MMSESRSRQLRAVLGAALTWGAAWAAAGGTIAAILGLFEANPAIESLPERVGMAIFAGVSWGVRFGIAGAVIGSLFSAAVRVTYMGRRLTDIHPARFAMLGAVVGGVGVPLYLQLMNLLTGGSMISWGLVMDDGIWASVFGAAAAGGSIVLARRAEALRLGAGPDELGDPVTLNALPEAELQEAPLPETARVTRR
jgi:hypothetical protein